MLKSKFFLIFFCVSLNISTASAANDKLVLGRIEKVILIEKNIAIDAKLDTGAAMASLSAKDIKIVAHNHQQWIKFSVYIPETQQKLEFIKPLIRFTHILKRQDEKEVSLKKL